MHVSIKALVPHGSLATAVLEFNSQRRYASAMPDDLYERDVLAWSEHQAALLRRAAGGERVNDIDWMHVVEEIEDVGLSELNAVQSYLRQILVHLLKLQGWPTLAACRHWRSEIVAFQTDAQHRFAPSMRQRINLDSIYARAALQIEPLRYGGKAPSPAPATCPVTLDALLTAPCAALEAAFATEKSAGTTQAPR
jgi:Domain of unknown function DUF29